MHTDALYALREGGQIIELGRGLYRLSEMSEAEHPDLAMVAARASNELLHYARMLRVEKPMSPYLQAIE